MSAQRSRWRRVARWRTPVIGVLASAVLIGAAIGVWDVDPREMLALLLFCVIGVAVIIGAAFLLSLLLRRFRR